MAAYVRYTGASFGQVFKTRFHSAPVDFECPEEFGYYPHPSDCSRYYVCVFGGALLESCTGGLVYRYQRTTFVWDFIREETPLNTKSLKKETKNQWTSFPSWPRNSVLKTSPGPYRALVTVETTWNWNEIDEIIDCDNIVWRWTVFQVATLIKQELKLLSN